MGIKNTKYKTWTKAEYEELKRTYLVMSSRELGIKFKTSATAVRSARKRLGLTLSPELIRDRNINAAHGTVEKRYRKKRNPFPGASIYVITYFANLKKQQGIKGKLKGTADFSRILNDIAYSLNLLVDDIRGDKKTFELVYARQIFCHVATIIWPSVSQLEIAMFLGYSGHSNVSTALKKIKGYFKVNDPKFMDTWYIYRANTNVYTKTKYTDHVN